METAEAAAVGGSSGAEMPVDPGAMTKEEQLAHAMRMSAQEGE